MPYGNFYIGKTGFLHGKKSIDTFMNKIQETFGSNILIGYGNWSRSSHK